MNNLKYKFSIFELYILKYKNKKYILITQFKIYFLIKNRSHIYL